MSSTYPKYNGPVKLLISDLAGTAVDFGSCGPAGAFIELFNRHGLTATAAEAREPMGMHKRDHIRHMMHSPAIHQQFLDQHGRPPEASDIEALFQEFIPLQLDVLPRYTTPIEGVLSTCQQLNNDGLSIHFTTGYNREMMDIILKDMAAAGFRPSYTTCAAEVPAGRPAPWMIYRCMEAAGVYPAAATVKIGDTVTDIQAGRAAGCWTVGLTTSGNLVGLSPEEFAACSDEIRTQCLDTARQKLHAAGAHFVIDQFSEITSVIGEINQRLEQDINP